MSQSAAISAIPPSRAFEFPLQAVEQGIPLSALDDFASYSGFTLKELLSVVIPPRTLKHRRQRNQPLSMEESDRLARVARIYELASRVFGDPEKARRWLSNPKRRFDGRSPLSILSTETGGRSAEEALIQIDEGMFI